MNLFCSRFWDKFWAKSLRHLWRCLRAPISTIEMLISQLKVQRGCMSAPKFGQCINRGMAVPLWFLEEERRVLHRRRRTLEKLPDFEIQKNFGVPWWGAQTIIELFLPLEGVWTTSIPVETKALTFLSYLRSGSFQWSLGTLSGISQSSASRTINSCCDHLISLARDSINFPSILEKRIENKLKFFELSGYKLQGIIGVVDGTHIAIKAPREDEFAYVNRKQQHSINCQVVANHDCLFLDVVAKWPGSSHDSYIWKRSSVRTRLQNADFGDGYFLCDKIFILTMSTDRGFALTHWLILLKIKI